MSTTQELSRRAALGAGLAFGTWLLMPSDLKAQPSESLAGQCILITGASSGFGYLGALHYARLGAKVVATMRNVPRKEARTLIKIAKTEELDLHVVELDVLKGRSVKRGVEKAEKIFGRTPDVLINNAGLTVIGPVEAQDIKATRLAFETNVIGYQRLHRAVLPGMRARGSGRIINMSSQSGRIIWPGIGHYCPTKFAVEAMSEALAYEVEPFGVRVCIIQPGGYPTQFWENRNKYSAALKRRSDPSHLTGYGKMVDQMGTDKTPNLKGDPMDIPKAISLVLSQPVSETPLRVMLSSSGHPQASINEQSRKTHINFLKRSQFGPSVERIHDSSEP